MEPEGSALQRPYPSIPSRNSCRRCRSAGAPSLVALRRSCGCLACCGFQMEVVMTTVLVCQGGCNCGVILALGRGGSRDVFLRPEIANKLSQVGVVLLVCA
jgi:hypothetical protein